jgi:hypothetical protein
MWVDDLICVIFFAFISLLLRRQSGFVPVDFYWGISVWFPSLLLTIGIMMMVPRYGGELAVGIVFCTQLGVIPVLWIKPRTKSMWIYSAIGGIAIILALVAVDVQELSKRAIYTLFGFASFLSAISGAIKHTNNPISGEYYSLGVLVGCILPNVILVVNVFTYCSPRIYFSTGCAFYTSISILGIPNVNVKSKSSLIKIETF